MRIAPSPSLTGADIGAVLRHHGPPCGCRAVGDEVHLAYHEAGGRLRPDAVVLVDGVVVRTSPSLPPRPVASCDEVWLGQPIERVLPCFGRLLSVLTTSALVELTFAATILQVHEGRVVHISARPVTAAS